MLGALIIAVATVSNAAQVPPVIIGSPTAGAHGDSTERTEQLLTVPPTLRAVEISSAAGDLRALQRLRRHTVGPFDQTQFGFRFVDVYFDRTLPSEQERGIHSSNATLQLVLATRRTGRSTRWWRVDSSAEPDIDDEPGEHELVRLATANRSLPIIDIEYRSHACGASSCVETDRHLLVDFRARVPRLIALLDEVGYSGGGMCGAYNGIYGTGVEIGCRWDAARADFRCAETFHRYDTGWGERRGTRFFLLESGQRLSTAPAGRSMTLRQFAERTLLAPSKATRVATLDRYGPTTVVETFRFGPATVVVLASPSLGDRLGVTLHAAVVQRGRETILREIIPRSRLEEGKPANADIARRAQPTLQEVAPLAQYTPDGPRPTFRSRLLVDTTNLKILQLIVSEGSARGVYLLGLGLSREQFTADAFLVAADGRIHNGCNTWMVPSTAVGIEVQTQPFAAILDIEPRNVVEFDEQTDEWKFQPRSHPEPCRSTATATWRTDRGFELEWQPSSCRAPEQPRRVAIDDQGRLTTR